MKEKPTAFTTALNERQRAYLVGIGDTNPDIANRIIRFQLAAHVPLEQLAEWNWVLTAQGVRFDRVAPAAKKE